MNDAPTLASLTGISFDDTDASNTFNNVTGTASGADRDTGASLAYSLPDGARDTSQSGYDAAQAGTYGTLYLNINSGAYLYIPNSRAIDGSKTTNTEQFNIQVSDGTLNETQTLTTTLNGVNDTPVLGSVSGFTLNDTTIVTALTLSMPAHPPMTVIAVTPLLTAFQGQVPIHHFQVLLML